MRLHLAAGALALVGLAATRPAPAADIEAGRARAETCLACHAAEGIAADPAIPSLAGQKERYLQWQLVFFRNGRRQSEIMNPLAEALSDEELRNLGAFFASLPSAPPATPPGPGPATPPDPGDAALREQGRQVATRFRCAACYTDSYAGNQAAPSVAHQRRVYTAKALRDYRSGARPSVGVAAMNEAAAGLSDADIAALAVFLEAPE